MRVARWRPLPLVRRFLPEPTAEYVSEKGMDPGSTRAQKGSIQREAHISAQHPAPSPQARLSRPDAYARWPFDHQIPPAQGSQPADGLIWRISERRAFGDLARTGRTGRTPTLWCSYVNDLSASPLRVAYSVGRSVGPAATRNLLRRRLRAIIAAAAPARGLGHGWLLIGARRSALELTFGQLSDEVAALLNQVAPSSAARDSTVHQ